MAQSFNNMWIGMIRVMQVGARLVEQAFPDVLQACQDASLVITTDTMSGVAEAEKLGLPWISVTLQPARIPVPKANPNIIDRTIWPVLSRLFVMPTNRFRKRIGAPPAKDITDIMSRRMILLPVSRHVAPPDPHWPRHVLQTGYWYPRQGGNTWSPPEDLLEFLQAGEKPIAVSLGVMSNSGKQAREGAKIVLQALRETGVRAVIQGWDAALRGSELPPGVYHAGSMPHDWLFEQVSAVVHHGGFGTTAAVLRSGVPGIVVPHVIDQFYWGQRVHQLGAGPKYISRGKLEVRKLSEAIHQALQDGRIRSRAAELGDCIRAEADGVTEAVGHIQELVGAHGVRPL
jgi:UDP:flavonoid glycosyltransferase YjiC (YdhE family)